jgi:WD40 repeat protein
MKSGEGKSNLRNQALEALDSTSDKPLWSHTFPKQGPEVFMSASTGRIVFLWTGKSDGEREEIARSPELFKRWKDTNISEGDVFAEAINGRDGAILGGIVIRTGKYSFTPEYAVSAGDAMVVTDNRNRVLFYSLETGQRKASWFGSRPRLSRDAQRLCIATGPGRLAIYDMHSLKQTSWFSFSAPVVSHTFSADGTKVLALTNDQTIFVLDATATNLH